MKNFRTERLRHDYLAARALCRAVLSQYTGVDPALWTFSTGSHGKPQVSVPRSFESLRFNLTHTKNLAICLVSRAGELGIDAEETGRTVDIAALSRHFLSHRERTALDELPPQRRRKRFFENWVAKEAYLKGIGRGVTAAPELVTVEFDRRGNPFPIRGWHFFLRWLDACHLAAAAVHASDRSQVVSIRWLNAERLLQRLWH